MQDMFSTPAPIVICSVQAPYHHPLLLQVPLHKLRSELEALGWRAAPPRSSSSSSSRFLDRLASELSSCQAGVCLYAYIV